MKEDRANLAAGISMGKSHDKSGKYWLGVLCAQYLGPDAFRISFIVLLLFWNVFMSVMKYLGNGPQVST